MTDRTLARLAAHAVKVRAAAARHDAAKAARNDAILAAHEAGHSLREIAHAADVSHQTVKHIIAAKE